MKDYEKLSREHFNKQAARYDARNTIYYSKFPKISCDYVTERLRNTCYFKLLDVGCGTGYLIDLLKQHHEEAEHYGLDLSPEMLRVASQKLGDTVCLKEGSALSLPYETGCFDVVTCVQSFHHYPDPSKAMAEAYRVTSSGGLYILSDTGCTGFGKWFDNHIMMKLMNSGDYAAYSKEDIQTLMKAAGFRIKETAKLDKWIFMVVGEKAETKD